MSLKTYDSAGREPSEEVKLTTAQKPPQGASGARVVAAHASWLRTRRGCTTCLHTPTNNNNNNHKIYGVQRKSLCTP